MPKVLMASSEASPFVKSGGLADVMGSLPPALHRAGTQVAVVAPYFRSVQAFSTDRVYDDLPVWMGGGRYFRASVRRTSWQDVPYFFIDIPELFDRDGLYFDHNGDYPDNHIRFGAFSLAVLGLVRRIYRPDVLHCHDWQAGLIPAYRRTLFGGDPTLLGIRTLFTIHNLAYQGFFGQDVLDPLNLPKRCFRPDGLEFYGGISFLKAGLWYADAISTVSEKYAEEIQTPEFGCALDGLLRRRRDRLYGILNGVDYSRWDPATDPFLPAHYTADDLSGKRICKQHLLREFGLPEILNLPLIGIVSRFAEQKGADLIAAISGELSH